MSSATEKKEGAEQTCKCGTSLICVKITKEWNGKTETKLQWQNKIDHKPHFKFAGPGKFDCVIPEKNNTENSTDDDSHLKKKQEEILQQQQQDTRKKTSEFTEEQLVKIDEEITKLQLIETIVTKKLATEKEPTPNPAKVGMYMKFVRDMMEEELG